MRLHELAKEMEADSKELLALAKKLGLAVKSHSSNLAPGEIALLKVGYKFRDLDEDEIFDRLESEAEEREASKKAEDTARKADAERRRQEREAAAVAEEEEPEELTEPPAEEVEEVVVEAEEVLGEEEPAETGAEVEEAPVEVVDAEVETVEAAAPEDAEPVAEGEAKPAGDKPAAPPPRRGAKILGRIELDKAEVAKSEATHEELESRLAPGRRGGGPTTEKTESEKDAIRRRRAQPKPVKWQPDPEDFAPVSSNQVVRPRFWERGPQRRQQRRGSRGPKLMRKNTQEGKKVIITPPISVKDLSQELGIRAAEILGKLLMAKGQPYSINATLEMEDVELLALEFGRDVEVRAEKDEETTLMEKEEVITADEGESETEEVGPDSRPPVVVFMGHVDHGKTSLLDAIRKAQVAAGEAGGITQAISAYQVQTPSGDTVTFLDTPGHRAFTEMRARGANCTDIVVLVVAADDGVMPQTEEAAQHAMAAAADMPMVVALNKVDRPNAEPLRVKQQLMGMDLLPEEFGGKVGVIETSATAGTGLDELLERIALEAEIRDLRATNKKRAQAYVIEASKEEGKGVVATVLVRDGTLKTRDPFLCGKTWGRVRMMEDDQGKKIKEAGPSTPVRVYGFKGDVPEAGDLFLAVEDERSAEKVAQERLRKERVGEEGETREMVTLENLFASLEAKKVEEIAVVLRADVQGSVEVLKRELEAMKHDEVKVRVLRAAVGGLTEEDIMLAGTSRAICIGFNVAADGKARRAADRLGVEIRTYQVIYELLDDLKKAMAGALKPEESEKIVGHVEVREVFKVSRLGSIAGCFVSDGLIRRNDKVRVVRDGKIIYTTGLDSLRRFKEDVREVKEGFECGLKLSGFDDIKNGDILEVFEIVLEERELTLQ